MNLKLLAVLTQQPYVYDGGFTWKMFREDKFTLLSITRCGRRNIKTHKEINNDKKSVILDISYNLDCLDKGKSTFLESNDYIVIPGKGLTTSINLKNKSSNKKQKARFAITVINIKDFRKFLKNFNSSPYLVKTIKQVHNEPTEA